jgi:hypothetical protein
MTPDVFKTRMAELIGDRPVKVWLTKTMGHRLDFIWSVGRAQLTQEETLAQGARYFLVGQQVPDDLRPAVIDLFNEFINSDHVRDEPDEDRRLRLITG